ncbi:Y-family DNA polymerase [Bartonella sp. HY406]|uniref:Y-family DNA polymerase n=1 Tax=Bartonella sp. HY406 TaxID=2979331 RepID=UPI0021CACFAB|nr:DNA polymerase Y family protein [Bartonella sp. HY406]UXN03520.1 DNA polymerase Y family protein [Bartonella sp. HY406]
MTKPLVNRLYLALYFPYLPTNRIMRSRQKNTPVKSENNALALISRQASGLVITAINRQAAAKGLYIGQSMSEAKAIFPEFEVQMSEPHKDSACLKWLAEAAERFTPLIAYNLPFGLMLDITGCDHLFGGAKTMLDRVIEFYQNLGFETKAAITTTPHAARIFARFGKGGIVEKQNLAPTLDTMPLKALELEGAIYHGLTKAGFKTIGAIRNLKPAALNARFGAVPVTKLQLLYGQKHHPISPITPKPLYYKIGRLNDPVMNEDQMIVVLEPLAQDFCKKLRDCGEGAKLIHIAFFRVDGARQIIAIETSKPLNEAAQLMRLIKERLTSLTTPLDIGYGFDAFAFAALECEKIVAVEQNLFVKSQDNSEITSFIDRLSTRLGHDRVLRLELHQSHIPEKAFAWQPALYAGKVKTDHFDEAMFFAQNQEAAERPCRIFVPPQPIDVVAAVPDSPPASFRWRRVLHRIRLAEGPERIGAEWWKNSAPTRDYYRVEDEIGRRFWIFRYGLYSEKASPKWFLHGLFA